ncbi:MAG: cobalt ECF transporter T component CbiQ [Planctomycetota bacterium]
MKIFSKMLRPDEFLSGLSLTGFKVNNFIERSLMGALSFLKESIFADEYAARPGFLQSLDPRIKTITFLLFIISIMITKNIIVLLCLYVLCLALTYLSKIHLWFFLKRTWIFIPLFSLFIVIPSLFSVFSPGEAIATLNIFGLKLTITHQGLSGAVLFVMRVTTSVSFAVLLSITTKHFELLKVLRIFRIPQVFVMTVGMCYRYIFLFVETIENTYLAIKSRIGGRIHYKKGQHIVAWNIAYLWTRSYQMNEQVYNAMLSRGYRGEPIILNQFKMKLQDLIWLCLVSVLVVAVSYLTY